MSQLTIFGDMMSQPTRCVILFCKLNKIKYDFSLVNLSKKEHKSENFTKINPHSYVPVIKLSDNLKKEF